MTDRDRDREIMRQVFEVVHEETAGAAPRFEEVVSRGRARAGRAGWAGPTRWAAAGLAATAAVTLVLAIGVSDRAPDGGSTWTPENLAAFQDWEAPLDFLLDTPGREWLGATPEWGAAADLATPGNALETPEVLQ